jgi:alpha-beta hydrolase superfamily lysophospholipase
MRRRPVALSVAVLLPASIAAGLAVRFGTLYRERAGLPPRHPVADSPAARGLPWEPLVIGSPGGNLPGWFIRADGPAPRPAVVLVHGWGSNRARMLPFAAFLRAAGFHAVLFDVRGHGQSPPETVPMSGAEFGIDAAAAVDAAAARPDVSAVGLLGHSMGGVGASLAAAARPGVGALVVASAPADPRLLVRETFRMAELPIPGVVAHPLAWLTLRLLLRPRGHRVSAASARHAVAAYGGPLLLVQGDADELVPLRDLGLLERAAQGRSGPAPARSLVVPGGRHRWLYEDAEVRRAVAGFFAEALRLDRSPEEAGEIAAATDVRRTSDADGPLFPKHETRGVTGASVLPGAAPIRATQEA